MAVFRIQKTGNYTIMSNHHLNNKALSLKAKGLLSLMLSLPDSWDYTTRGLAAICKEGVDGICATVRELEAAGYIVRRRVRDASGKVRGMEYTVFEQPQKPEPEKPVQDAPAPEKPEREKPVQAKPDTAKPAQENPAQLNTKESNNEKNNTVSNQISAADQRAQCRTRLLENIEYSILAQNNPMDTMRLDELVELMRDLVQICEPGGRILDPFAGAGTTVLAAAMEGYEAVGIEMSDTYFQRSTERLKMALVGG